MSLFAEVDSNRVGYFQTHFSYWDDFGMHFACGSFENTTTHVVKQDEKLPEGHGWSYVIGHSEDTKVVTCKLCKRTNRYKDAVALTRLCSTCFLTPCACED